MSVDLPLPLGPSRPSFVPGERTRLTSRKSSRPPSDLATFFSSISLRVLRCEAVKSILAAPCCGVALLQIGQFAHHLAGAFDAALGFGRARFCAAAEPFDFAAHAAGQRLLAALLGGEELLALLEELAVGAVVAEKSVGILPAELDDAVGDFFEKSPVVADRQRRELRSASIRSSSQRMPSRSR